MFCKESFPGRKCLINHHKSHHWIKKSFSCTLCQVRLSCRASLYRHHRFQHNKNNYNCTECSATFLLESTLAKHRKVVHGKNQPLFKCLLCYRSFTYIKSFRRHIKVIHEPDKSMIKCKMCHKQLSSKISLKVHLLTHSKTRTKFECPCCKSKYLCKGTLEQHLKFYQGGEREKYWCPKCSKKIVGKSSFRKHLLIHSDNRRKFPCKECDKVLLSKSNLEGHVTRHHCIDRPTYTCMVCSRIYHDKHSYELHVKGHKQNAQPNAVIFSCSKCNKSYLSKKSLSGHMLYIHGNGNVKVECKVCGKSVLKRCMKSHSTSHAEKHQKPCALCGKLVVRMKAHLRTHSTNRQFHKCTQCDKHFIDKTSLSRHLKNFHEVAQKETCHICLREYPSSFLGTHIRKVHEGKDSFECSICKQVFKGGFQQHMKTHRERKKQTCSICKAEVLGLKQHLKFRHGNLTFNCTDCNKTFISNVGLRSHMEIHMGNHYTPCPVCKKEITKQHLKRHMDMMHPTADRKKETCQICHKQVLHLKLHLKQTHNPDRKIDCTECSKTFLSKQGFKLHMSYEHGDGGKRECPKCGKYVYGLKEHLKTHTGEHKKPCPVCDKNIPKYSLKHHMAKKHKNIAKQFPLNI